MADLDTASKRASSVQILAPSLLAPPLPDGTLDQGDRQHIAWSYSGILAAGAVETPRRPRAPDIWRRTRLLPTVQRAGRRQGVVTHSR